MNKSSYRPWSILYSKQQAQHVPLFRWSTSGRNPTKWMNPTNQSMKKLKKQSKKVYFTTFSLEGKAESFPFHLGIFLSKRTECLHQGQKDSMTWKHTPFLHPEHVCLHSLDVLNGGEILQLNHQNFFAKSISFWKSLQTVQRLHAQICSEILVGSGFDLFSLNVHVRLTWPFMIHGSIILLDTDMWIKKESVGPLLLD